MQTITQQTCHHRQISNSTNSELIEAIKNGIFDANKIQLLTADSQTGGRGQHGRSWQSPVGNVYLSVYYPTNEKNEPLTQPLSGLLSLCVGYYLTQLPVIMAINKHRIEQGLPAVGVKWANDIGYYQTPCLVDAVTTSTKKTPAIFHKLAGVLIEPVIHKGVTLGVVIGVGVNVETAPKLPFSESSKPSKLLKIFQKSICLHDLLTDSIPRIQAKNSLKNTKDLQPPSVGRLYQPIAKKILQAILRQQKIAKCEQALSDFLQDFSEVDILRNRSLEVLQISQSVNSEKVDKKTGTAVGIDKRGSLQLLTDDNELCALFTGKIDVID